MVDWLLPPHATSRSSVPSDAEICSALDLLCSLDSSDAFQQELQERQQVLFSERTLITLCLTSAQEYIGGNSERAESLTDICTIIADARSQSFAPLKDITLEKQKADVADSSRQDTPATGETALLLHIELLTHSLTCISRASLPSLWAELHREYADDYFQLAALSDPVENTERAITDYDVALTQLTSEREPFVWARAHVLRGIAYRERQPGEQSSNIEQAIVDFTAALTVYTYEYAPVEWAVAHIERGLVYRYRMMGDSEENLALALADFDAALQSISRDDMSLEWAKTSLYRIDTYMQMHDGVSLTEKNERALNDYTNILDALTFDDMPDEWLEAHWKRGLIYLENPQGNAGDNRTRAISDFNTCLEKPVRTTHRTIWGHVHRLRGIAYADYPADDQRKNAGQAIDDFTTAIEVFTREDMPFDWALAHLNRGSAYRERSYITQSDDIEQAIADFDAALEILTEKNAPEEWATAAMNRGLSCMERMYGEHAENTEQAIADFNKALAVSTRENDPAMYALGHLNLGVAYTQRIRGDRAANITHAIACLDTALELFTPTDNSHRWGLAHRGLWGQIFLRTIYNRAKLPDMFPELRRQIESELSYLSLNQREVALRMLIVRGCAEILQDHGSVFGWSYPAIDELRVHLTRGLIAFVQTKDLNVCNSELDRFMRKYEKLLQRDQGPFPGCIHCRAICLYRLETQQLLLRSDRKWFESDLKSPSYKTRKDRYSKMSSLAKGIAERWLGGPNDVSADIGYCAALHAFAYIGLTDFEQSKSADYLSTELLR